MLRLRGVRVNNLKNIDLNLPRDNLIVISGVSGSGKSSLALETLLVEGQRRYLDSLSTDARQFLPKLERPLADLIEGIPPTIAITAQRDRQKKGTVGDGAEIAGDLGLLFEQVGDLYCPKCQLAVAKYRPEKSLEQIDLWRKRFPPGIRYLVGFPLTSQRELKELKKEGFLRVFVGNRLLHLDDDREELAVELTRQREVLVVVRRASGNDPLEGHLEWIETCHRYGDGYAVIVAPDGMDPLVFDRFGRCPKCRQSLAEQLDDPSHYRIAGRWTMEGVMSLRIEEVLKFVKEAMANRLPVPESFSRLQSRLEYLDQIGLGHLSLDRKLSSLSAGAVCRVRLAAAIASNLVNVLYIVDEPSAGLHRSAEKALLDFLRGLRDRGNSVIVIDHAEFMLKGADQLLDLGPLGGSQGGSIVFQGPPSDVVNSSESVTGAYLSGRLGQGDGYEKRKPRGWIELTGLQGTQQRIGNIRFPLGVLCAITGPSGSGKSRLLRTLVQGIGQRASSADEEAFSYAELRGASQIEKVLLLDEGDREFGPRTNPATFVKVFSLIRKAFAETPMARARNFSPSHFSFNAQGGRCETCKGMGSQQIDMQFLPDLKIPCEDCQGRRFRKEVLEIRLRDRTIADVLAMLVPEAISFFRTYPSIVHPLQHLVDVGLGYLPLGQPISTMSGGERQRLRLARYFLSVKKEGTLFLMDEPTNGLHIADVAVLLNCFQRLLERGHSIIVVEHRSQVLAAADWVIELS